jgi:succinate--hydroxymethylglutarate CoA-transferase
LGLVEELEHPRAGKLKFVKPGVNYPNLPADEAKPPPLLGEQTVAILAELGYGKGRAERLEAEGIVLSPKP